MWSLHAFLVLFWSLGASKRLRNCLTHLMSANLIAKLFAWWLVHRISLYGNVLKFVHIQAYVGIVLSVYNSIPSFFWFKVNWAVSFTVRMAAVVLQALSKQGIKFSFTPADQYEWFFTSHQKWVASHTPNLCSPSWPFYHFLLIAKKSCEKVVWQAEWRSVQVSFCRLFLQCVKIRSQWERICNKGTKFVSPAEAVKSCKLSMELNDFELFL